MVTSLASAFVPLTDRLQGLTSFTYDANGNLLTVRDAKGQTCPEPRRRTTTHTYDALNRLATRTDPLSRTESFTYDLAGNLQTVTDRKGQVTTCMYDALSRRTQASYADATVATFTYDAASRLTQVNDTADPHRPITRTYDPLDRLLTETTSLGTVTYTYDTAGRRTSMTVSGQTPVIYTHDQNARLRTITQAPLNPAMIDYDAANRRTLLTLPNGVSTEYVYDLGSRLSCTGMPSDPWETSLTSTTPAATGSASGARSLGLLCRMPWAPPPTTRPTASSPSARPPRPSTITETS